MKELRDFEKVPLQSGEKKTVSFVLVPRDFAYWDSVAHKWKVAAGDYRVHVGPSSAVTPITLPVTFSSDHA